MTQQTGLARALADHVTTIRLEDVSQAGREMARSAIIDTVGVTLAGAIEPVVQVLRDTLGLGTSNGEAQVFGLGVRTGALDAALLNGAASHALDYDDMASAMGGHPSVPIVPVVFALSESLHASGHDLMEAYVHGFEAECRLGRVVHPHHYEAGWHPTSTLGVFGATAAAARLLRLDAATTATAFSLCASLAAGVKANFGTMTKPFHAGKCARDGLFAAQLASKGFTANPLALEKKQGFFAAYDGLENVHLDRLVPEPGTKLEIERKEIGLKQFPCCGSTHPSILAMLENKATGPIDPEAVASIDIRTHRARLPHTDNPFPTSPLDAKFSIQYATVRALLSGAPKLDHFEGKAFDEPIVQKLLERTKAAPFEGTPRAEDQFAAEVTITMADGTKRTSRVAGGVGRGPLNPMSDEEMWEKFSDCASKVIAPDQTEKAFAALGQIEQIDDVASIAGLFAAHVPTLENA